MVIPIIIDVLTLLLSFGVIFMTYHVYISNRTYTTVDNYLKQIINLYFKIEDDTKAVKVIKNSLSKEEELGHYYRRIETNTTLLRYYIRKFPVQYSGKDHFTQLLTSIAHSPENDVDYDRIGDCFKTFCKSIEEAKDLETRIDKVMGWGLFMKKKSILFL